MSPTTRRAISFRLTPEDIAYIDQQADLHKVNRTRYVSEKLTDRLGTVGLDRRVDQLEERLTQVERRVDLAYE